MHPNNTDLTNSSWIKMAWCFDLRPKPILVLANDLTFPKTVAHFKRCQKKIQKYFRQGLVQFPDSIVLLLFQII